MTIGHASLVGTARCTRSSDRDDDASHRPVGWLARCAVCRDVRSSFCCAVQRHHRHRQLGMCRLTLRTPINVLCFLFLGRGVHAYAYARMTARRDRSDSRSIPAFVASRRVADANSACSYRSWHAPPRTTGEQASETPPLAGGRRNSESFGLQQSANGCRCITCVVLATVHRTDRGCAAMSSS